MSAFHHRTAPDGSHVVDIQHDNGGVIYTTDRHRNRKAAHDAARRWHTWFENVAHGNAKSIYYILTVPITWPGPPSGSHRYSGLHFKIGRTRNVLKRLQNLRTGTSEDLIVHALEPGDAEMEAALHERFKTDRRQGEWFAASPALSQHVYETWQRNRMLPPEHQAKLLQFAERSQVYAGLRRAGPPFDMVNPSLNEPWHGSVFLDLVYTPLLCSTENES